MNMTDLRVIMYGGLGLLCYLLVGVTIWQANGRKVSAVTYILVLVLIIGGTWMGIRALTPPF